MTTIEEVALRAKVSVATVSRVINDKGNVSPATAERVRIAIKELKYQPNAMGVLLRRERTGMVLILLHSVDNPFFSSIVQGVEKIAHENDYNVLISTTYGDQAREKRYIKLLQRHFVDGVILITNTLNREEIQELNAQFPVAQVLEYVEGSETTHISVDFYQAGRAVMEHLIGNGRKRIAFAHTGLIDIISTKEKYRAYRDALTQHQLPILTSQLNVYPFGFSSGQSIARETLQDHPDTDAFFASSDLIACGIMDQLKQRNIRIPEDVAIVGFDNTIFAETTQPKLTSVELNSFNMGVAAMTLILERLKSQTDTHQPSIIFPFELIQRESS